MTSTFPFEWGKQLADQCRSVPLLFSVPSSFVDSPPVTSTFSGGFPAEWLPPPRFLMQPLLPTFSPRTIFNCARCNWFYLYPRPWNFRVPLPLPRLPPFIHAHPLEPNRQPLTRCARLHFPASRSCVRADFRVSSRQTCHPRILVTIFSWRSRTGWIPPDCVLTMMEKDRSRVFREVILQFLPRPIESGAYLTHVK